MAIPVARIPSYLVNRLKRALLDAPSWHYMQALMNTLMGQTTTLPPAAIGTITIGTEAANVINVSIPIVDGNGDAVTERAVINYWLSTDSAGDTVGADPGAIAIGTNGTIIVEFTDDVCGKVVSEANGVIDFNVTHTSTNGYYLNFEMPWSGKKKTTSIIQFA